MKRVFLIAALLNGSFSTFFAQKTATWQGGAPGQAAKWECPKNWKEGRVPDEMSDVVVPDCSTAAHPQPVISSETEPIHSLRVESGASLEIEKTGLLIVFESVEIFGSGRLSNSGILAQPRRDPFGDPHAERPTASKKKAKIKFDLAQSDDVSASKKAEKPAF